MRVRSTVRIGRLAHGEIASATALEVQRNIRRDRTSAPATRNYSVKQNEEIVLPGQRNEKAQDERK